MMPALNVYDRPSAPTRPWRRYLVMAGAGFGALMFILWCAGWFKSAPEPTAAAPESADSATIPPLEAMSASPRRSLVEEFKRAGVPYPAPSVALLAFKDERRLEFWATHNGEWTLIRDFPILAASGTPGPKLQQGDKQVPEGIYKISNLLPNSSYHLSMKIDYPNAFDRKMAAKDKRTRLGGDICIHGKDVSIGCIALGDAAIEDVFAAVKRTGVDGVKVIIAPNDLRTETPITRSRIAWLPDLYKTLRQELRKFPRPAGRESPTIALRR